MVELEVLNNLNVDVSLGITSVFTLESRYVMKGEDEGLLVSYHECNHEGKNGVYKDNQMSPDSTALHIS
jgi:hypothetical protein